MCEIDGHGVYVCDLTVNGDSTDASLTSIYYATSGNWETWGTDADGNDYCCNIAPQNAAKYLGGSYDDVIDLNYDNGTVYHLTNASVDMFGNDGEDDLSGADNTTVWDYIEGGADDDVIQGLAGDDKLNGDDCPFGTPDTLTGNDIIYGGDGEDDICGGLGIDVLYGDADNDAIDGREDDDTIHGGAGDDINLQGGTGYDTIYGDEGVDTIDGGDQTDYLYGGPDGDTINGNRAFPNAPDTDYIKGEGGEDTLYGDGGDDMVCGGDDDDSLSGGNDDDLVFGGAGTDSNDGDTQTDDCETYGWGVSCEAHTLTSCPW